jgi:hypothetical protein
VPPEERIGRPNGHRFTLPHSGSGFSQHNLNDVPPELLRLELETLQADYDAESRAQAALIHTAVGIDRVG